MKLRKDKWKKTTLGEIATIIMGQSPPSTTYNKIGKGLPFFQGKTEFTKKHPVAVKWCSKPNKIAEPNDILITVRAPVGATNIANQKCCIGRGIAAIRRKQNNDYILYFLQSIEKVLSARGTGTIFGGISGKILLELPILFPPLEEQHQIAALFQALDRAIEDIEAQEQHIRALRTKLAADLVRVEARFGHLFNAANCRPATLGQIAKEVRQNTKSPLEEGIERYVGLEHLEPGNLKISRWGNVAEGTTFTKTFKEGDVLFGRRRAYLKKAARADFEGLCSGDITVLRANPALILPDLLPYYLSADAVFDFAVSNSAGSLSPRAKWRDLSKFECSLPDLKMQEKILAVFQTFDAVITQCQDQQATLKTLKQTLLAEIFGQLSEL
jgi:type I restriction enzyme, S subunit